MNCIYDTISWRLDRFWGFWVHIFRSVQIRPVFSKQRIMGWMIIFRHEEPSEIVASLLYLNTPAVRAFPEGLDDWLSEKQFIEESMRTASY